MAPHLVDCCISSWSRHHGLVVVVSLSWFCHRGLVVVAIVIIPVVSIIVSITFVVTVIINCRCRRRLRTAMGVAVVVALQRWRRSNGGGGTAMVVDRSHCRVRCHRIELYSVFVYQIDIPCSFLRRPHTDRFPEGVPKKLWRNRNHDSSKKMPQERKKQESGGFLQE